MTISATPQLHDDDARPPITDPDAATPRTGPAASAVAAADAFAATLSEAQRSALLRELSRENATAWSNLPLGVIDGRREAAGLQTATFSPAQWDAFWALLEASTGPGRDAGVGAIRQQLRADDHLLAHGGTHGYGRDRFRVAFLGTPGERGTWQLQVGGHHLAVAHTYRDGQLTGATPAFRGVEPFAPFRRDGALNRPLHRRHEALTTLLTALDDRRRDAARLPGAHDDVLLGPGRDRAFPSRPLGIAGADLTDGQRVLLLAAVAEVVADAPDADATRILEGYERDLGATHLGFAGTPALAVVGDHVRIDGPSVWIELSMRRGFVFPDPHPHMVWRDRRTDYGGLWG